MRELEVCVGDGDERARGLPEMEMERDRARLRQFGKQDAAVSI